MEFRGSDIISVNQFEKDDIEKVFSLAHRMRKIARRKVRCRVLDGFILGNLFFEASTRSRLSFATAFMRLGGQVNSTTGMSFSSMVKGETLADTIRVIHSYCDILTVRHPQIGAAEEVARYSDVPVINAGDGPGEHPTQALLDLFTILEERGKIEGVTVAMVGNLRTGRTVHSLAKLLTLFEKIRFVLVAPDVVQMPGSLVKDLRSRGFDVVQTDDFDAGIQEADVVYCTRIQDDRPESRSDAEPLHGAYVLTREKLATHCRADVTVLHPLPRSSELAADVDGLPNAAYFRQAENGVLVRMALFVLVLGKEEKFV